ncbi:MAG: regulatory protein RecX [bacterium]
MTTPPNLDTLYLKLTRYCSFQERCSRDVEQKLREWKVPERDAGRLIQRLKRDGFLDELRFARSFARGKFRVNRWGRVRIRYELQGRGIPDPVVSEALREIGEEEYLETIGDLIRKKKAEIKSEKTLNIREKIITFVVGKGFETELVLRALNETKIEDGN